MTAPLRLLVVDDDADFRMLLTTLFGMVPDVEVVGDAADGHEALEVLAATSPPPDAAVVDLLMPGMDGYELIAVLRRDHPGIALVANSAIASSPRSQALRDVGVPVVEKTADTVVLLRALRGEEPG